MKTTIQSFSKHSLALAVIAAFGLSASAAVLAQQQPGQVVPIVQPPTVQDAPRSKAEAEAQAIAAAEVATRLGRLAREAAETAQAAARVATQMGSTRYGAEAAAARQSAADAQRSRNEAIDAVNDAQAARTAARDGSNPQDAAMRAQQATSDAARATQGAVDASERAGAAAVGTAQATQPRTPAPTSTQSAIAAGSAMQDDPTQRDVIITSSPPDTISGDYSINLSDMDENDDGFISREEARANSTLSDEFDAADRDRDGRLSAAELKDWTR